MPVIQHSFLRSEENVIPTILNTKIGVWEDVYLYKFQYLSLVGVITIHVGRSHALADVNAHDIVTDVIANISCIIYLFKADIIPYVLCICFIYMCRQMLKPWQMLLPMFCDRCLKPPRQMLSPLLCQKADVKAFSNLCGRCYTTLNNT